MGHNRDYKPEDIAFPQQMITESELVGEMQKSYIEYAMSVIVGRALPDVRDGLKPVHRRILYALYEDGLTSDKPYKKSATAVGDVLGRYHPHGDASIYDALVRLAQDFSLRHPLIDGHGNFGSVDGDPPAAYRYTEARLSKISNEMLRDIDKETVDWDPNFDESRKEPHVLPARFPNLLVNGSSGIAVGMATNIPPHNLGEVIDACICIIDNPNATLDDLMQHIKGPDFPTKGIIMGRSGIRSTYATGRGRIVVRARATIEENGRDHRERIIVTELPYQVNKRQLIKSIADQVKEKRLEGISDLRDETDIDGMRIVIELKRDANAQVILNRLYAQTAMQTSFCAIMLALVDNQRQPKILSLRHILDEYIAFQDEIIVRRTNFDLKKALERAHLLEGLIIAIDNIDEVIKIIRSAYDDAREKLMSRFGLDEVQAQAILDMRLKALQGLDREKLQGEYKALEERIAYYRELIASDELQRKVLKEELLAIRDKYSNERRTQIEDVEEEIVLEDLIERHTAVITMSQQGYVKRIPSDVYSSQRRGGKGIIGMTTKDEDFVVKVEAVDSHSWLYHFTNTGKVQAFKAYQIPEASRTSKGTNVANLLELTPGEKVTAMISVSDEELESSAADERYFLFVTKNGTVKRTQLSEFSNRRKGGKRALSLDEGDELVYVRLTSGHDEVIIATRNGNATRFDENDARVMGRSARGVRGIRIEGDDCVVGCALVDDTRKLLTVSEFGIGKRSEFTEFQRHNRGGKGVCCQRLTDRSGMLCAIASVDEEDDIMMITDSGTIVRIPVSDVPVYSRTAGGVIVMRLDESVKIVNFAVVAKEEEKPEPEAATGEDAAEEAEKDTENEQDGEN